MSYQKQYFSEESIATLTSAFQDPKLNTFNVRLSTAAATAAHYFVANAFLDSGEVIEEMAKRTGIDFPDGDRVMASGLIAAAAIVCLKMEEEYGKAAVEDMYKLAGAIKDGVYESLKARIAEGVNNNAVGIVSGEGADIQTEFVQGKAN